MNILPILLIMILLLISAAVGLSRLQRIKDPVEQGLAIILFGCVLMIGAPLILQIALDLLV